MWHIENPNKTFDYLYKYDENLDFQLMALMTKTKYNTLPLEDREMIESLESAEVREVKIKNPNNPVSLVDGVILVFGI